MVDCLKQKADAYASAFCVIIPIASFVLFVVAVVVFLALHSSSFETGTHEFAFVFYFLVDMFVTWICVISCVISGRILYNLSTEFNMSPLTHEDNLSTSYTQFLTLKLSIPGIEGLSYNIPHSTNC